MEKGLRLARVQAMQRPRHKAQTHVENKQHAVVTCSVSTGTVYAPRTLVQYSSLCAGAAREEDTSKPRYIFSIVWSRAEQSKAWNEGTPSKLYILNVANLRVPFDVPCENRGPY